MPAENEPEKGKGEGNNSPSPPPPKDDGKAPPPSSVKPDDGKVPPSSKPDGAKEPTSGKPEEGKPPASGGASSNNAPSAFVSFFESASPTFVEATPSPTPDEMVAWLPELTAGTRPPSSLPTEAPPSEGADEATPAPSEDLPLAGHPTSLPTYLLFREQDSEQKADMAIIWMDGNNSTRPLYLDSIMGSETSGGAQRVADHTNATIELPPQTALSYALMAISATFALSAAATLVRMKLRVERRRNRGAFRVARRSEEGSETAAGSGGGEESSAPESGVGTEEGGVVAIDVGMRTA